MALDIVLLYFKWYNKYLVPLFPPISFLYKTIKKANVSKRRNYSSILASGYFSVILEKCCKTLISSQWFTNCVQIWKLFHLICFSMHLKCGIILYSIWTSSNFIENVLGYWIVLGEWLAGNWWYFWEFLELLTLAIEMFLRQNTFEYMYLEMWGSNLIKIKLC